MWKEEEHGRDRVSAARFRELQQTGSAALAVSCPFCLTMFEDEARTQGADMQVLDLAEILLQAVEAAS